MEFTGLTGMVRFKEGRRTNVTLDLLKLKRENLTKVGEWNGQKGLNITDPVAFYEGSTPNITLVVMTNEVCVYAQCNSSLWSNQSRGLSKKEKEFDEQPSYLPSRRGAILEQHFSSSELADSSCWEGDESHYHNQVDDGREEEGEHESHLSFFTSSLFMT